MTAQRLILISIAQYQEPVLAGQLSVMDVVHKLDSFGVAGIELRREIWPDLQAELPAVRDHLNQRGLTVTYATFSTLFTPDSTAHDQLLRDIDTARALGSSLLRIFSGPAPLDLAHPAWDTARRAVDYAAAQGITLALENADKAPGNHLSELARTLRIIDHPALRTNIDTGNYHTCGQDVVAAINALAPHIAYAHLKDKTLDPAHPTTALGDGLLPMAEIVAALNNLPQPIPYCFEFAGGPRPAERIHTSLAFLRALPR